MLCFFHKIHCPQRMRVNEANFSNKEIIDQMNIKRLFLKFRVQECFELRNTIGSFVFQKFIPF